jgi:hypothetical protein
MPVSCSDYRLGRRLLALKKKLAEEKLDPKLRQEIEQEAAELERELGMD